MASMAGAGETDQREKDWGLAEIVLDPYVNAIHVMKGAAGLEDATRIPVPGSSIRVPQCAPNALAESFQSDLIPGEVPAGAHRGR